MKAEDVLTFGKFKGKTLNYVLHEYPSYIIWLHDNIPTIIIDQDLLDEAYQRDARDMAESEAMLPKNWR